MIAALLAHAETPAAAKKEISADKYATGLIDLHYGVAKLGYGWVFPRKEMCSVGIGGIAHAIPYPRKVLTRFLRSNNLNGEYKFRGHTIPAGGIPRKIITSRVILSGDSAGFVDTFTGEGIAYAIRSGQLAATTVSKMIKQKGKKTSLKEYEIRCNHQLAVLLFLHQQTNYQKNMEVVPGCPLK